MKKFLKSLVAAMIVCLMAVSFTSCGISDDPAKVKENLTEAEYVFDEAVVSAVVNVFATANWVISSWTKIEQAIFATSKDGEDSILVIFCNDKDLLKSIYEDLEAVFEKAKGEDKEADVKKGKSGSCAWIGTKAAIKAAK